jgi:hypothetical protein
VAEMSVEGVVSLPHDGLSVRRLVNDDRSSDPPRDGASHIFRYYQVKMDGERVCSDILKPLILIHEQLREKELQFRRWRSSKPRTAREAGRSYDWFQIRD